MSVNKNEAQHTILSGDNISANTRFVIIHNPGSGMNDYTISFGDLSGTNGLLYAINEAINNEWTDTTIEADSDKSITLGAIATYRKVIIEYSAERGTTCYRAGTIEIIHDGTYSYANDSAQDTIDEETRGSKWFSVSKLVNGGEQMAITITTDDADADITYLKYRIKTRIPIHS